jgi:hypothetical protein
MVVRKAWLSKYFIPCCALMAAVVGGAPTETRAQIDQNLQSRFTTFSPPITVLRPEIEATTKKQAQADTSCKLIDDPRGPANDLKRAKIAAELQNEVLRAKKKSLSGDEEQFVTTEYFIKRPEGVVDNEKITQFLQRSDVAQYFGTNFGKIKLRLIQVVLPTVFKCGAPQPVGLKISFPFNPTYETNVLKSDTNVHSDSSIGFGGGVLLTGPGIEGRPYDVVGFGLSSASARYSAFPSKSLDLLTEQAIYQIFLDARHIDGTPINVKREEVPNLLTIDTLSLGLQNQTGFMAGYHAETADLLTPQATLSRQNIALSDAFCSTPQPPAPARTDGLNQTKAPSNVKGLGFCNYLDLALTVGQTFSDVATQQNVSVAGSATLGWRLQNSNWKITLPAVVTARDYENVIGGRRDVLFQIGPAATFTLPPSGNSAPSFMFSLAVNYNQNYSTLSTAAWHGFIVQPTLTLAFQPPVAVKADQGK